MRSTTATPARFALLLALGVAPLAHAQEPRPAAAPAPRTGAKPAPGADPNLLRGPAVTDGGAPPGAPGAGPFADPNDPGRRARARTQAEAFDRALAALSAPDTPEELRLSPAQQSTIAQVRADYRAAEETFRRENMEELRALRRERAPGTPGAPATPGAPTTPAGPGEPATPDEMISPARPVPGNSSAPASDADRAALMERLRRLEDRRPDPAPFQARIWGALSDAQQERARADIARFTDEALERRARQRLDELAPGSPGANAPTRPGASPPARNAPPAPADARPGATRPDARGQAPARLAQAAAELGLTTDQLRQIRDALAAPPADAEKHLSFQERCARRLDALPAAVLPPDKKDRVRERFFTHAPGPAPKSKPAPADRAKPK